MINVETTAYQQLLNTTGSSFSLTALSTDDVDSDDDDIERSVLPCRPGPTSSPRQAVVTAAAAAAAAAGDALADRRETSKKPTATSLPVSAVSNSSKVAHNSERCVSLWMCVFLYVS